MKYEKEVFIMILKQPIYVKYNSEIVVEGAMNITKKKKKQNRIK